MSNLLETGIKMGENLIKSKILSIGHKLKNSGFFHIVGANVFVNLISFFNGILLVRLLAKEEYGAYTYANNILGYFLMFIGMGMVSGVFQLCSETITEEDRCKSIYNYGGRVGNFFNFFIGICILVFVLFIKLPVENAGILLAISAFIPLFQFSTEIRKIYLRFTVQNQKYSYTLIIEALAMLVCYVLGALFAGSYGVVISRYVVYIIAILFMTFLFNVPGKQDNSEIKTEDKDILYKISLASLGANSASQLLYLLDISILGIVLSDSEVIASYKVATTIPIALEFISQAVIIYVYPHFVNHRKDRIWLKSNFVKLLRVMGIVNFIIACGLIIFAPVILKLLFGEQYLDATVPFRILAVEYFIKGTFRIISGNILASQRRIKFNLILSILTGVVNIIGNLILIPRFGAIGAAISTCLVVVFSGGLSTMYMFYILNNK